MYLADDTWRTQLAQLAEGAKVILLEPGRTHSLRWELDYISTHGLQTRLFIMTPPYRRRWWWWRMATRVFDVLNGWHAVDWGEFAAELRTAGLEVSSEDPGHGAVISCRADHSSIVLARALTTPTQFVDVIEARVSP